ncbi:hypothetical protein T4B_9385 [Trichinella pseudospiralis]|uniref:Uncharacterized protein n=1 Tax=Trichinella pseudospiralis TaxID=6337 RepID=A0A0V1GSB5_TRIPS|nr:hypothetical protein T4B_9385 [Trichinella pseudospiralis]
MQIFTYPEDKYCAIKCYWHSLRATPQAMPRAFYKIFEFFRILAPGVAPGYASGQIKICIFPQAMPMAFYCTIFAPRLCENLHIIFENPQPEG